MNPQNQCCTLSQAEKLKSLGVAQESLFYWNKAKSEVHKESIGFGWTSDALYAAFTVAELFEMVPEGRAEITIRRNPKQGKVLPTVIANYVINGLESGSPLFTLSEINQRLTS